MRQTKITEYFKPIPKVISIKPFRPELMQHVFSTNLFRRHWRNDDVTDKKTFFQKIAFKERCERKWRSGYFLIYHGSKAFQKILALKSSKSNMFIHILNVLPDHRCKQISTNQQYFKYYSWKNVNVFFNKTPRKYSFRAISRSGYFFLSSWGHVLVQHWIQMMIVLMSQAATGQTSKLVWINIIWVLLLLVGNFFNLHVYFGIEKTDTYLFETVQGFLISMLSFQYL